MKLLRPLLAAALALALLRPAAAQVRVVAAESGAEGAASAAASGVSIPAVPLVHLARMASPTPAVSAGAAFLADKPAQAWFQANRPEMYPSLVRGALALKDWQKVLTAHDDPRILREAVLSRPDSQFAQKPGTLLAAAAKDPALAGRLPLYRAAALDWSMISPETRGLLAQDGLAEERWDGLTLNDRYAALRAAYDRWVSAAVTAPYGSEQYADQYEAALEKTKGLMSDEELSTQLKALKRARADADEISHLRETGQDADAAAAALGGGPAPEPQPELDMSDAETHALELALTKAVNRELLRVPAGRRALTRLRGAAPALLVAKLPYGALGQYLPQQRTIAVDSAFLMETAAALGYSPRDLLTSRRALEETAKVLAHVVVHEGVHHGQFRDSPPRSYSQQWEREAFMAQAAYLRQARAADPQLEPLIERLKAGGAAGQLLQTEGMLDPAALADSYRTVPTLERAASRLILGGQKLQASQASRVRAIEAELALRRRRDAGARARLEHLGVVDQGAAPDDLRARATSDLRAWRRALADAAAKAVEQAGRLMDRSRAEHAVWTAELAAAPAR